MNGSPLEFNISFAPEASTFNVTFNEAGLPPATTWGVVVNNSTLQTSTTSITTSLENGSYLFAVEYLSGFQSSPSSGSVNVAGAAVTVDLAFTSGGDYPVDLAQSGLPNGTLWSATLGGVTLYSNSSLLAFTEPNGTYPFTVATTANYSANFTSPVVVNGSSVRIGVTFSNTTYLVTFLEMGLPLGALWTVTATNEATRAVTSGQSTATSVALRLAVGTYLLSAAGPPGYRVSLSSSALSVHGAGTLAPTASFAPAGVVGAPPVVMIGLITTVGLLIAVVAALGAAFGYTRYRSGQWRAEGERWVEAIRKEQSSEYDDDQPGQR